jgi:hypothetical protein
MTDSSTQQRGDSNLCDLRQNPLSVLINILLKILFHKKEKKIFNGRSDDHHLTNCYAP